jgi:F-type H+-transporting ATPase subunit a
MQTLDTILSPLDQFELRDLISINANILGNLHISLTNIGLYLLISCTIILTLSLLATNYNKIVSNSWSISQESIYSTVHSIVINQINANKGQMYFPFLYALFIYILINNLIGLIPYSFASTSHFILTFSISFTVVLGATLLGFQKHGLEYFSLFVPAGCPLGLLPLLVFIEFISHLSKNVSLGLRLAANILSGHMLLNILAGFTYNIMTTGFIYIFLGLVPLLFIIAFSGLELAIAFIQAQVFTVLTAAYIKEGLDLH